MWYNGGIVSETYPLSSSAHHSHETETSHETVSHRELALQLVEAFGNQHMTPARRVATELILDLPRGAGRAEQDAFVMRFLREYDYEGHGYEERPDVDIVAGIVEDYRWLQTAFSDYITSLEPDEHGQYYDERHIAPRIVEALQSEDDQPISSGIWTKPEKELFPVPDLARVINTFSTKGDHAQGVGLETAMIAGSLALADLMTTPYRQAGAYKKAVYAKNFLAPICSIIGMDALESALNDEVDVIAGRNIGDSLDNSKMSKEIDPLLDETDRMVSLHFGRKNSSDPERFHFAKENQKGIIQELVGEADIKSAIKEDAPHSMFFQVGHITTPSGEVVPVRSRGKGRGSYIRKVIKNLGYYGRVIDAHAADGERDIHPIDLYGSTVIAEDNDQLAQLYADAVVRAVGSSRITPYPAPSRDKAVFIIKGPETFQESIRRAVTAKVPDIDMDLFDFRTYDSGFTDAKITGFYETGDGRAAFAPFEMQFSTPPARLKARIGGQAAHFIFKMRKVFGEKASTLSDESLSAMEDIWRRKQNYFNSIDDIAKEGHRTEQGRQRVEALWRRMAHRQGLTHQLAQRALK